MSEFIPNRTPLVEFEEEKLVALIKSFTPERLATLLDVTDLKADTLGPKMKKMADWAKMFNCASVCVNPVEGADVLPAFLKGSKVKECYVIDFPLGKLSIEQKAQQTSLLVKKSREIRGEVGMIELDMVINTGRFKDGDYQFTLDEINAICEAADGEHVKVIVRSSELTEEEVWKVSEIVRDSNAAFIKNSTGMDNFGALPDHMWIMRQVMGPKRGVKAAGGISDAMTAMRLMYAAAPTADLQNKELFRMGASGPMNIISSMGWLLLHTEAWVKTSIIPCHLCPYHHHGKQRRELREYDNKKCQTCKFVEYRKHKDI